MCIGILYISSAGMGFLNDDDEAVNEDKPNTPGWMSGLSSFAPYLTKDELGTASKALEVDDAGRLILVFSKSGQSFEFTAQPDNWLDAGRLTIECPKNADLDFQISDFPKDKEDPHLPREIKNKTNQDATEGTSHSVSPPKMKYTGTFTLNRGDTITITCTFETPEGELPECRVPISK